MQKYINQLLQDLRSARRSNSEMFEESESPQSIKGHIEDVERFIYGEDHEYEEKFGKICGIQKIQFPPASRLSDVQMVKLCEAIEKLMWTWSLQLHLPDELPVELAYHFLTDVFEMETVITNSGNICVELCDYEVKSCTFGEYCTCKVLEAEMDEEDRIYDEKIQRFTKDLDEKLSASAEKMNYIFSFGEIEIIESKIRPIITLAEWLDISMEDFPNTFPLWEQRANKISKILMRLWHPDDEMILILNALDWDKRFLVLKNHLKNKVWFDGIATVHFLPLTEEEKSKIINPLDTLDTEEDLPL